MDGSKVLHISHLTFLEKWLGDVRKDVWLIKFDVDLNEKEFMTNYKWEEVERETKLSLLAFEVSSPLYVYLCKAESI